MMYRLHKIIYRLAKAAKAAQDAAAQARAAAYAENNATEVDNPATAATNATKALELARDALRLAREAVYAAYAAAGGGDFAFSGTIGGKLVNSATDPRIIVTNKKAVFFGGPDAEKNITTGDTLTVTVNLFRMAVLQEVDINGKAAAAPFFTVDPTSYISLRRHSNDVVIVEKTFTDPAPTTTRNISVESDGQPFPLPLNTTLAGDIDTVLDVVLKYRAFGRAVGGTLWNIANGFCPAVDDGSAGGATDLNGGILIRFGSGGS
jgi:hypothetical protein